MPKGRVFRGNQPDSAKTKEPIQWTIIPDPPESKHQGLSYCPPPPAIVFADKCHGEIDHVLNRDITDDIMKGDLPLTERAYCLDCERELNPEPIPMAETMDP